MEKECGAALWLCLWQAKNEDKQKQKQNQKKKRSDYDLNSAGINLANKFTREKCQLSGFAMIASATCRLPEETMTKFMQNTNCHGFIWNGY